MIRYENDNQRKSEGLYYAQARQNLGSCLHLHDSFELVTVQDGVIAATVDGKSYTLHGGDALLIFPNQIHAYHTPRSSQSRVFIFPAVLVGEYYEKMRQKLPDVSLFSFPDPAFSDTLLTADLDRWMLKSLLYRVVSVFDQAATYHAKGHGGSDLVGQILSIVSTRYTEPLTMRTVSEALGYDHRYLTNLLQKNLGTTFRRLLNEYRIVYAQELLLRTNSPIEQIAGACGYDSLCSFNRNFKALTGRTPTDLRRK